MEQKRIIIMTILEMEKPFLMSDLFEKLALQGVTNKKLILSVLDLLLDSGLVDYKDISQEDIWYYSLLSKIPA